MKIPKYKRDGFVFIANLKDFTADPENPITLRRDGYLLSEHYSTPSMVEKAHWVKKRRNLLISDNGNYSRMKAIAKRFSARCEVILKKAQEEKDKTGLISQATLKARELAIQDIAQSCTESLESHNLSEIIGTQLQINPHYMIGLEDFTIPVFMLCGMLHPVFDPQAKDVEPFQNKTVALFGAQMRGEYGHAEALKKTAQFMVLHAFDYPSAYTAAQKAENLKPDGVAISYGGPMKSRRYITEINLGTHTEQFGEKLPEPYLISVGLTQGIVNGSDSDTPVHILGVGSPILVALLGTQLHHSRAVSIDSTAPFKDAFEGRIYGSRYAFLKMKRYKLAAYALINNEPYTSTSPFFKAFEKRYPSNWAALRSELGVTSSSNLKEVSKMIEDENALVEKYIPFMARFRGGKDEFIYQLRIARAGHNYWILRNICVGVRRRRHDPEKLLSWMEYQVNRYTKVSSGKWATAVKKSFELIQNNSAKT